MSLDVRLYWCLVLALTSFATFLAGFFVKPGMVKVFFVLGGLFGTVFFGIMLPLTLHELLK